jgi:hypothetical protein
MSDAARSIPRVLQEQPPGKESRNARFRRLATKRVKEAHAKLNRIGALATPKPAYSEEEARAIVDALRSRVNDIERQLLPTNTDFSFE